LPDTVGSPTTSLATGYVGLPYELLFTAVVPDLVEIALNPGDEPTELDLEFVQLDSITGLPPGVDYACNPDDCIFLDQTQGCLLASGVPEEAGEYSLVVHTTVGVGFAMLNVTFPGLLVSGQYKIIIEPPMSVNELEKSGIGLGQNVPNPFGDFTEIRVDAKQSGVFELEVYNVIGKLLHSEQVTLSAGRNAIPFDGSKLQSGMYFYSIRQGNDRATRRMVVHHP